MLGFVLTGYQDHPAPRGLPLLSFHAVAQGSPAPGSWKNHLPRNWSLVSIKVGGHCLRSLLQGGYKHCESGDLDSNPDSAFLPCITTGKSFNLPNL